jgi:hypothetical protein
MKLFKKELVLTQQEESIVDLVKSMTLRKDCLIEINPETMDYLLSIEELQYFLLIDCEGVQISNHNFFITRRLRSNVVDSIKSIAKAETSARRQVKVENIFSNELDLLTKINKAVNHGSSK